MTADGSVAGPSEAGLCTPEPGLPAVREKISQRDSPLSEHLDREPGLVRRGWMQEQGK